jgi:hypothetical protein
MHTKGKYNLSAVLKASAFILYVLVFEHKRQVNMYATAGSATYIEMVVPSSFGQGKEVYRKKTVNNLK